MRVTVDVDGASVLRLLMVYFNLRYATGKEPEVRVSRSGRSGNRHFIVRGVIAGEEDVYTLRRWLGDDPRRIWIDESSVGKPKQVLFMCQEVLTQPDFLSPPFKVVRRVFKGSGRRWRKKEK